MMLWINITLSDGSRQHFGGSCQPGARGMRRKVPDRSGAMMLVTRFSFGFETGRNKGHDGLDRALEPLYLHPCQLPAASLRQGRGG